MSRNTFASGKFYLSSILSFKKLNIASAAIAVLLIFHSQHYYSQYSLGAISGTTSFDGTAYSNSATLQTCNCPTGQVVVGIQGKQGLYIDNVTIKCATLNSNGTLGTANTLSSSCQIGSSTGGSGFNHSFSSPTAMVGYEIRTGNDLDGLTLKGQTIANIGSAVTNSSGATNLTSAGGSGGTGYTRWAPNGHVIVGVNFRSGTYGGGMSFNYAPITACSATAPTSITGTSSICSGSSVTLTANGGTGSNYQWGTGSVGSNIIGGQTGQSISVSPTSTTTYWVRRTQSSPCSNTSGVTFSVSVTTPSTAPTNISASVTTICSGSSVTLTATGGSGSSYQWGTGTTVGSNIISGTGASITVNPTSTTTYWVRRTNSSPCSNTSGVTRLITVNPTPSQPSAISAPVSICAGTAGTYSVTNVSGVTYNWTYSGTGTITGSGNSITLNPTTSGTLTVTPSNSCGSGTARTYVISLTALNAGAHNTDALSMCDGGNPSPLTFTTAVSGGSAPYSYQWQLNNSNISSANTNSYDPPALTPGTYSYNCKITDACGNVVYTSPKVITVTADPDAPSATKSPNVNEVCFGTTLTINTPTYGANNGQACGFEYAYSTNNGSTWSSTSSTIPSFQAVSGSTNKIRIRVIGGCASGCSSSSWTEYSWNVSTPTTSVAPSNGDYIWRGNSNLNWNTASNWFNYNGSAYIVATQTPQSTNNVFIPQNQACVINQPTIDVSIVGLAKNLTIESGATLTMTTGTLNVNGNFVNNGTFVAGTGTVAFNTAGTVSGNATTFNNVDVNNGVNFGSNLSTVNGTMTINNGGWVNTNPPTYGLSSLLKYNTGGTYGRWLEWSATSGAGYPNDVQVSNNTTINYPNTGGAFSTNLGVRRDLTIDGGSNLYMDYGTGNASGSLTVGRHVTSAGDLSLGNQIGGDIYVGGDWTRTTGNFYANNRAVFFNGATGAQTITKSGGETFPFMIVNKASGNVVLANNVTVSGGLTLTNGLVEVGTNNMIMGGASLTGGSSASYVKTASSGVLSRNVGGSATTFPVGNGTYNPAMVTNTGTADIFTLRVIDNVTADGTGVGATTTEAVVNRTWMVNENTSGGSNVTLRLYWNGASEEVNAFSPASAFIAHYIAAAGMWDNIGFSGQGAGYFETNGITSFSPFTISSSTVFAPLPVELVSFQANCAGDNKINVSWTTASEHNSSHYVVEHSRNGNEWTALAMVAAAGNSTSLLDYTYVHENANAGTNYYRLTQYDNDGVFEQFNVVSAACDNMNSTTTLSTYPNPSEGSFYISLFTEDMEGAGVITLTDAKGTVVHTQDVSIQKGNTIFHMDNLNVAPGMYYIQVANGNTSTDIVKHSLR
jgi:hypothetical protein